jgi:hypothetical protein
MKRPLILLASLACATAAADPLVSYTGAFAETDHPTIAGAHVVTLTTDGTLSVPADVRLLRVLVVGGGGGGGFGGGAGGQVVDWTPETPTFLKSDDRYTAVIGYGGFRSYQTGSWENRGHNGHSSSFSCTAFSLVAFGGGGGLAFNNGNGRWDPEEPSAYGNGGGGSGGRDSTFSTAGSQPGADGCFRGGTATNYGQSSTGCGGAGGGGGAGGAGGDSQVLHNLVNDDDWQDENGNYEHAGDGGPGVESDITGAAVFYGGGGGGGIRRSVYKHGGAGGAGGGGRGAGLFEGSFTESTAGTDGLGGGGGGGGTKAYGSNQSSSQGGRGVVILLVAPSAEGEEPTDRESAWAIGGTVSTWRDSVAKKNWVVHEFRNGGTLVVKRGFEAELLLVGGGGSGGKGSAAGGGAGGLVHSNSVHLAGGTYTVSVGAGGAPSRQNGGDTSLVSANGTFSLVALGGGGGGGYWGNSSPYFPGLTGGSSGGSAWGVAAVAPTPGPDGNLQGFPGGSAVSSNPNSDYPGGSGGGGAGGPGEDSAKNVIGNGGPGLSFDITGETRWYAGGGGGGYSTSSNGNGRKGLGGSGVGGDGECAFTYANFRRLVGHPGLDGTGSGGGGGGQGQSTGGRGGCGVLIVRYLADPPGTMVLIK